MVSRCGSAIAPDAGSRSPAPAPKSTLGFQTVQTPVERSPANAQGTAEIGIAPGDHHPGVVHIFQQPDHNAPLRGGGGKGVQLLVEEADASGQKTDIAKGSSIVCRKELFQGRSAEQQHPQGRTARISET